MVYGIENIPWTTDIFSLFFKSHYYAGVLFVFFKSHHGICGVYVLNYLVEYYWSCEMLDSKNNKKKYSMGK